MRRGSKPSKAKAEAKPTVVGTAPQDDSAKIRDLEKRLAEAQEQLQTRDRELVELQEQQTATSEILRVISGSPTDVQPVFSAILDSATRLCSAHHGILYLYDGAVFKTVAFRGLSAEAERTFLEPIAPGPATGFGRMLAERRPIQIADVTDDVAYRQGDPWRMRAVQLLSARSAVWLPLLKVDAIVGALAIYRQEVRPFSDKQIELALTFADQAVIAIENVRLFKELEARNSALTESLEQQTATAEILQVISSSPTDLDPVLEAIARNAARLCEAADVAIARAEADGQTLLFSLGPDAWARGLLFMDRRTLTARAISEGRTIHAPDLLAEQDYDARARVERYGWRTALAVPLIREGVALGAITARRSEVRPFSDQQVKLLETFADQAVIAIENVRLFTELQQRTSQLTRSVEKLTALGEVSQAVSSTLDLEMVLDTITERARQLAGADGGAIYEYDEVSQQFFLRATRNVDATLIQTLRATPLRKGQGVMGRATEAREPIQIGDIAAPGVYESNLRDVLIGAGYRALLSVPIVREGQTIGSLSLNRKAPGEFPPEVIDVLKTFATQSALAIQNARLFREIADKSAQLEAASRHKSEFLANMSHELRTPLNAIIGFSEVLTDRMFGELNEKQEEYLKDIYASGTHLLSLINDILDLSKIEAGRMELELSEFHLPTALDSALTLVRERAGRRGITLQMNGDERLAQIQADERKVRQVVLNLLSNAIKFTPEGGQIEVDAVPKDGFVEISISDTGVGIAPEDQEAIFEEFRQVGTADKKLEGTGLGLTLCRKFVELHGGKIWVKSEVGVGSTFTFTIPVHRGE
jgi:two-component system, NtrC family, sensor kinase